MIQIDANNSVLSPAMLGFIWCHLRDDCTAFMCKLQYEALLNSVVPQQRLSDDERKLGTPPAYCKYIYIAGVPIAEDDSIAVDQVLFKSSDDEVHGQIKHLYPAQTDENHDASGV